MFNFEAEAIRNEGAWQLEEGNVVMKGSVLTNKEGPCFDTINSNTDGLEMVKEMSGVRRTSSRNVCTCNNNCRGNHDTTSILNSSTLIFPAMGSLRSSLCMFTQIDSIFTIAQIFSLTQWLTWLYIALSIRYTSFPVGNTSLMNGERVCVRGVPLFC